MGDNAFMFIVFTFSGLTAWAVAARLLFLARRNCFVWRIERPAMWAAALHMAVVGMQFMAYSYLRWLRIANDMAGTVFSRTPAYLFIQVAGSASLLVLFVALLLYPRKE